MEPITQANQAQGIRVPLFPLPNVVLFPGAILPLHIFEERYKTMTGDALAGNSLVAMALLRPGWEKDYYGKPAIEPVVCIGRITSSERLDDGKYNFLLNGESRARITGEESSAPYRIAQLQMLGDLPAPESNLAEKRRRLQEMFDSEPLASMPSVALLKKIIDSPMPTGMAADLIAFYALSQIPLKQSLLAETDVLKRVCRVISALDAATPVMELASRGASQRGKFN
jgi:uncharacterized protein